MFNSEFNVVRPRRNKMIWIDQRTNDKRVAKNGPETIYNKSSDYHVNFDHKYVPVTISKPTYSKSAMNERRKEKCTTCVKVTKTYAQEYCRGTSLHGLQYVGAENVTMFERLFWILAFIGAMAFAAYFISNIYEKWIYSPVIVAINPQFKTISSIPFPAITICNMNQVKKSVAEAILASQDEVNILLLEDFCDLKNSSHSDNYTDSTITKWSYVEKFMLEANQPCSQMLLNCRWEGNEIPCRSLMNSALTDEGVCCTFNRVSNKFMYHNSRLLGDFNITIPGKNIDWTPESGYPDGISKDTWPYRPAGAGMHLGLTIVANVATEDYYCSSTSSVGLKVRLHSPIENPLIADFAFFLHPRKESAIMITAAMDEATSNINKIPISKRQCFFSNERELYFYRTYTKRNCELECISNFTLRKCSCVPYYLPKNVDVKICGKKKEQCYRQARSDMDLGVEPEEVCNCLPGCYEISYMYEISTGDMVNPSLAKFESNGTKLSDLLVMHFFFSQTHFKSYQKSELFGFTEFLANSGGLLGLFLGFSFLSAVEIFYHLTLKLWCTYYVKRRKFGEKAVIYPFAR